jgi:hypothetical protein
VIRKNSPGKVSKKIILLPENIRPRTIDKFDDGRQNATCVLKQAVHTVVTGLYGVK